jgi:GTP:adenosylcobinamide-phosphate guanylyltransferase
MKPFNVLVLAGRRRGTDPLAEETGVSHKALLDVAGVPMLVRVLRTLLASKRVNQIAVSIDDHDALDKIPELKALIESENIIRHASLGSPSRSVQDVLGRGLLGERILVVTADHALLTPEIVDYFLDAANDTDADLAVGAVPQAVIESAYPEVARTYLRFKDGGYSGANLFAFQKPKAEHAAKFWIIAEDFRKKPWRLASKFGLMTLLLFALRRLRFDATLERASSAIGCTIRAVSLPFAEAAIDVDKASDLALVTQILVKREGTAQ